MVEMLDFTYKFLNWLNSISLTPASVNPLSLSQNSTAVAENAEKMEEMTNDTGTLLPSDIALIASSLSKIGSIGAEKLDKEMVS